VGTGSGWHAALLGLLAAHVWSVEREPALARSAATTLAAVGVGNVTVCVGDGARGLPEQAPFDAVNVAAAARHGVPGPLVEQLAPGGRLVAPVGDDEQHLVRIGRRADGTLVEERLEPVRFVPLL